jgi:hypothetical protein
MELQPNDLYVVLKSQKNKVTQNGQFNQGGEM